MDVTPGILFPVSPDDGQTVDESMAPPVFKKRGKGERFPLHRHGPGLRTFKKK